MPAEPASPTPPPAADTPPAAPEERRTHRTGEHDLEQHPTGKRLTILSLTALGVVYGDIGTSPLYALREAFTGDYGVRPTSDNVYGVLSLIVWSLTLVVSVKYLVFVLKADNRGEGGILALLALLQRHLDIRRHPTRSAVLVALGLFGAALLYGDGVITPAITVLSAMEGLEVATPLFSHLVVPASVLVLFVLFMLQRYGTARIGGVFGPVMIVWFLAIAALGVAEIARAPRILLAINPWDGVRFFAQNGRYGFLILGAVVLVVTGAEALYADMGHFGRRPIRVAWFALVLPCLLLNYFGQGALLLRDPAAAENPFYRLVPPVLLYPMVVLATAAAVIASQALISGAFSLTRQAMQLGYSPRITVVHTSESEEGQIYVREVNAALMVGSIWLVIGFGSSSALASAYGIAVTGTMVITTLLFYMIARERLGWSLARAGAFLMGFLIIDLAFLAANAVKIESGGWVPLVIALAIYTLMTTWQRGRVGLARLMRAASLPMDLFLRDLARRSLPRVPGTAVFMTSDSEGAPVVMLHHVKHNKMLHEQVVLLSVQTAGVPAVPPAHRLSMEPLGQGFHRVITRYGFMETPNIPEVMRQVALAGVHARPMETTYYLGRERIIPTGGTRMARWRKRLFSIMSRNARSATEYFGIPPNRVVELGAQIEL